MHLVIEKKLKDIEIWSYPSLIHQLQLIKTKKVELKIHCMQENALFAYNLIADKFNLTQIPYYKTKRILYQQDSLYEIQYTLEHGETNTVKRIVLKSGMSNLLPNETPHEKKYTRQTRVFCAKPNECSFPQKNNQALVLTFH